MSGLSGVPAVSCGVSTWADAPALELVLTRAHFPILSGRCKKRNRKQLDPKRSTVRIRSLKVVLIFLILFYLFFCVFIIVTFLLLMLLSCLLLLLVLSLLLLFQA